MELSPQAVAAATFKTVKRGYDPDEVRAYLIEVSASLEASHQQATAMEARARAAIAKLQDATQHPQAAGPAPIAPPAATEPTVGADDSATISRTLLLAQRTADAAIAEAEAEAKALTDAAAAEVKSLKDAAEAEARRARADATRDAESELSKARAEAARLLDEARTEAHRAKSESHLRAEAEVKELSSRREALIADLDVLEAAANKHRERLRETSSALAALAESVAVDAERPSLRAPLGSAPLNGDDSGAHRVPPPPITGQVPVTGQVPLQPGVEPLVSPRPTSADEVRSMWQEAERAEQASYAAPGTPAVGADDATPVEGVSFDAPTPTDGIRR